MLLKVQWNYTHFCRRNCTKVAERRYCLDGYVRVKGPFTIKRYKKKEQRKEKTSSADIKRKNSNQKKQKKEKKLPVLCWQNPHTNPTFLPPSSSLFSPSILALISLSFSITRSEHMHATNTRKQTHTGDKEALKIGRLSDGAFTMGDVSCLA